MFIHFVDFTFCPYGEQVLKYLEFIMLLLNLKKTLSLSCAAVILLTLPMPSATASDLREETCKASCFHRAQPLREQDGEGEVSFGLLSRLPNEMAYEVFSYLTREEFGRLACVSRGLQALTKEHLPHYSLHDKDTTLKAPRVDARHIEVLQRGISGQPDHIRIKRVVQYGPYEVEWSTNPISVGLEDTMEVLVQNLAQGQKRAEIHFDLSCGKQVISIKKELYPIFIKGFEQPRVSIEQFKSWVDEFNKDKKYILCPEMAAPLVWREEGSLRSWCVSIPSIVSEEDFHKWVNIQGENVKKVSICTSQVQGASGHHDSLFSLSFYRVVPMGDGTYGTCFMNGSYDLRRLLYYSWCKD